MWKEIIRQFHFTKTERHGAVALLCLALLVWLAPTLYHLWNPPPPIDYASFATPAKDAAGEPGPEKNPVAKAPEATLFPFDPNATSVEDFVRLGLSERVARTIVRYRERGGQFRSPDDLQKIYSLPEADFERLRPYIRLSNSPPAQQGKEYPEKRAAAPAPQVFAFDPNTATEPELLRLGLAPALVGRLLRYREKGGYFFEKKDFRKLYGLPEADYQRLEAFIHIAKSDLVVRPAAYAGGGAVEPPPPVLLDINAANMEDWQRLPGIGATRAGKIVRYREKLGGFVRVEQVAETQGLPDSIFQQIRAQLAAQTPVFRKINLNTATPEVLNAHPYFSFKQTQIILNYRAQHGPFQEPATLSAIAAFQDRRWLDKVYPYLTVD